MQKQIIQEFGVPKVSQAIAELLTANKAKENTRYALNRIGVIDGKMAATNGRTLIEISPVPEFITDGNYYITGEGFLLKDGDDDLKFPKWRDIIPTDAKLEGSCYLSGDDNRVLSSLIQTVVKADYYLNYVWLYNLLKQLGKCNCQEVEIWIEDNTRPLMLKSTDGHLSFLYLQMPINKNA